MTTQAAILSFAIEDDGISHEQSFMIYALEDAIIERLKAELPEAELDGHELPIGDPGDATIFIYGPSAERIAAVVAPLVRQHWPTGPVVLTTYPDETLESGTRQEL